MHALAGLIIRVSTFCEYQEQTKDCARARRFHTVPERPDHQSDLDLDPHRSWHSELQSGGRTSDREKTRRPAT